MTPRILRQLCVSTLQDELAIAVVPASIYAQLGRSLSVMHLNVFGMLCATACYQVVKTTPFTGKGWGGSMIGLFWGGITVQGLLPYYYTVRRFSLRR